MPWFASTDRDGSWTFALGEESKQKSKRKKEVRRLHLTLTRQSTIVTFPKLQRVQRLQWDAGSSLFVRVHAWQGGVRMREKDKRSICREREATKVSEALVEIVVPYTHLTRQKEDRQKYFINKLPCARVDMFRVDLMHTYKFIMQARTVRTQGSTRSGLGLLVVLSCIMPIL